MKSSRLDTITNRLCYGICWFWLCRGNQDQISHMLQSVMLYSEHSIHVRFLNCKWVFQLTETGQNVLMKAVKHELHLRSLHIQTVK